MEKHTEEYRQASLRSFKDNVLFDYKKYYNDVQLHEPVGDAISSAQWVEFELKNFAEKDRSSKELLDDLVKWNFFEIKEEQKEKFSHRVKKAIDCRNWLVHASFNETMGRVYNKDKEKEYENIFVDLADEVSLLKRESDYEIIRNNINNNWRNEKNMFCLDMEFDGKVTELISYKQQWTKVKIIMTKYVLYELLDVLNNNPFSIFAE